MHSALIYQKSSFFQLYLIEVKELVSLYKKCYYMYKLFLALN
jgi:hypothetical protein